MPSQQTEHRSYATPDDVREFPHGRVEIVKVGGAEIGRLTLEPGWRWSNDVKPIAGTDSCQATHLFYCVSGRMGIRMNDGTEAEAGPGDIVAIDPGHDAWVIGDEPCVSVDFGGYGGYAKG
jgi:mannose-6-phosphate isomerase-like protein (cupin superfamily)